MNRMVLLLLLIFSLPAGSAQLLAQNLRPVSVGGSAEATPVLIAHPLLISSGDMLDVNVFDTPELSTKLRVDEHGAITLPLAGALVVSGLTAEQAGQAIQSRLSEADILKNPHVAVSVLEYATQGIAVLGEIKSPGIYPLRGAHGLLDLISAAGGVTADAGKSITVTHRDDPKNPVIAQLDSRPGSSGAFNVDLRPGDTIVVSHAGLVYVVGDVGKPGGFLIENNDRLTVLQAIALAQGANKTAALNQAKLIRKTDGVRTELPVPLKKIVANTSPDLALNDGDIIFVPSSAAKSALKDVESILPGVATAVIYKVP